VSPRPPVIAVLDWGIGGVDALVRLARALPARYVYRSDSGYTPYGKVPTDQLAARIDAVARDLDERHGLDALVLACNAASTTLPHLALPFPVVGVIAPGVALVRRAVAAGATRVGIIGGLGTIASGVHLDLLRDLEAQGTTFVARPAQPLSAFVEAGHLDGPEVDAEIGALSRALMAEGPLDALLLACTHYPALTPVFARHLPRVGLLDPVDVLIEGAAELGVASWSGTSTWVVETSGDPESTRLSALAAFGVSLGDVRKTGLDS